MITRLRVVLEDPRQLLSGAVTDYASRLLIDTNNDPASGDGSRPRHESRTPKSTRPIS